MTLSPRTLSPCRTSPGANAEAVDWYCSPGRAARPNTSCAFPRKPTGIRTPTGQALVPLASRHFPLGGYRRQRAAVR